MHYIRMSSASDGSAINIATLGYSTCSQSNVNYSFRFLGAVDMIND